MVAPCPYPVSLPACQSFARLEAVKVRGRGPSFSVTSIGGVVLADRLTLRELAGYLDAYSLAQITAAGPCCPLDRIGTA
jgi:hypothetical protein